MGLLRRAVNREEANVSIAVPVRTNIRCNLSCPDRQELPFEISNLGRHCQHGFLNIGQKGGLTIMSSRTTGFSPPCFPKHVPTADFREAACGSPERNFQVGGEEGSENSRGRAQCLPLFDGY